MRRDRQVWTLLVSAGLVAFAAISTSAARAAEKADVDLKTDIVYGTAGGEELKLDLATPRGSIMPCPRSS